MYDNSTSRVATHFLCGAQLINEAVKEYQVPNENWSFPIRSFGHPSDPYYAEVWTNGMDWSMNDWIIEAADLTDPKAYPLLIFDSQEEEDRFNRHDFELMLDACMGYRRMLKWFKIDSDRVNEEARKYRYFADEPVWNCMSFEDVRNYACPDLVRCHYSHASQLEVSFWINAEILDLKALRVKQVTA